jgi:hypothetical protein
MCSHTLPSAWPMLPAAGLFCPGKDGQGITSMLESTNVEPFPSCSSCLQDNVPRMERHFASHDNYSYPQGGDIGTCFHHRK